METVKAKESIKKTYFRWIVVTLIFFVYTIATADRANFGIALPYIKKEYGFSNTEAGLLLSLFFSCYAIAQIPMGFLYKKFTVRTLMPLAMIFTSLSTFLIGQTSSLLLLKFYRIMLGVSEAPLGIGCGSIINQWFPPKEKGTAMGLYFAAMKCGPVIVPPICALIIVLFGWREIFLVCAIPGTILAIIWFYLVANRPEESRWVSKQELHHIRNSEAVEEKKEQIIRKNYCPHWIDQVIRAKKEFSTVDSIGKVFSSWNIIGSAVAFFFMSGIINTIMAWIPTYLISEKHFSTMKMGFMSSAPFIGAVLGNIIGGWISDRVFHKRRKPLMIVSGLCTVIMMYSLIYAPDNVLYLSIMLFLAGFLLNLGYSAFVVYPMGLTTKEVYPMAYSVVNTGGAIGAAAAPFAVGVILDAWNWDMVFLFLAVCALLSLLVVTTIIEPIAAQHQDEACQAAVREEEEYGR